MLMRLIRRCLFLLTAAALASTAQAAWPDRPVTIVVPWPAGASSDAAARTLATLLAQETGGTYVVQNKTGAAGNIGAEFVLQQPADGYTFFLGSMSHIIGAALARHNPQMPIRYDVVEDFDHIAAVTDTKLALVVNPGVKATTVAELVALAKSKPNAIRYSSSGIGSMQHLIGEVLQEQAGIQMVHVPYRGIAPSVQDLVGGIVDASIESVGSISAHVKSGRLRALAVASDTPVTSMPDVPTMASAGLPGVVVNGPQFFSARKGTPKDVLDKVGAALDRIMSNPQVQNRFLEMNIFPIYKPAEETTRILRSEREKWAGIVKAANIRVE